MKRKCGVIMAAILLLSMLLSGNAFAAQGWFGDLSQGHWAGKEIKEMQGKGILSGFPDGNFYPERFVTRAQYAKVLVLALNIPTNNISGQTFTDVPSDFWAYRFIEAARSYLTGYENEQGQLYFAPHTDAVREDVAVAIVKAKGLDNQTPDLTVLDKFIDTGNISPELRDYMAIAVQNDIIKGRVDNNGQYQLDPQYRLTRAQCAVLLHRVMNAHKVVVDDTVSGQVYQQ